MLSGAQRAESKQESKDGPVPHVGTWTVYIIQCRSGKLYTGMTGNLLRRWGEHLRGGARFTRGDPAVRVIHVEPFRRKLDAQCRERQLKGWTRRKKLALAAGDLRLLKKL